MILYGMVKHDAVRYGTVRCGVVWYDMRRKGKGNGNGKGKMDADTFKVK